MPSLLLWPVFALLFQIHTALYVFAGFHHCGLVTMLIHHSHQTPTEPVRGTEAQQGVYVLL